MREVSKIIKKIARVSFMLGSTSLILGIILSFAHVPVNASSEISFDNQPDACTLAYKCEAPDCVPDPSSSWTAPAGYQICMIAIKAGTHFFTFTSDGCVDNSPPPNGDGLPDYCVSGVGSDFGEAWRECVENGQTDCHAISHSEFYIDLLPPTSTPTQTSMPSLTPTETSISSPTPTETSLPSPTPTETDFSPSPTPTSTTYVPTKTQTSTPTGTPVADTVTPTATSTGTPLAVTVTSTTVTTGTLIPETPTPTVLGTQITPTSTQPTSWTHTPVPSQSTLPAPQVTGTQPAVLIPVTGMDLTSPLAQLGQLQHTLINIGLALLGIGLIVHGIGKKIDTD